MICRTHTRIHSRTQVTDHCTESAYSDTSIRTDENCEKLQLATVYKWLLSITILPDKNAKPNTLGGAQKVDFTS